MWSAAEALSEQLDDGVGVVGREGGADTPTDVEDDDYMLAETA
jgi:hypothetical protein